jgi:hypothetical protein
VLLLIPPLRAQVVFNRPVSWTHAIEGHNMALGDFDADGEPDLVVADDSSAIRFGQCRGIFRPAVAITPQLVLHEVEVADLDGDGHPDLVGAARQAALNDVFVLHGLGGAAFADPVIHHLGGTAALSG